MGGGVCGEVSVLLSVVMKVSQCSLCTLLISNTDFNRQAAVLCKHHLLALMKVTGEIQNKSGVDNNKWSL